MLFLQAQHNVCERFTTSHRACTVVVLFGSIRDYWVLSVTIRDYSVTIRDYLVTIRHYFVTIQVYFVIISDYFMTIQLYSGLFGGGPDEFRLPQSCF